jgi:hypothetical protein
MWFFYRSEANHAPVYLYWCVFGARTEKLQKTFPIRAVPAMKSTTRHKSDHAPLKERSANIPGHPDILVVHIVRSSTVAITHCKLKLAVRKKKVSRRKSDCCGWFVVSRFVSRTRTARVKHQGPWVALLEIGRKDIPNTTKKAFEAVEVATCNKTRTQANHVG